MENQPSSVNHLTMTYGLYMGLALILNSVVFYVMGTPFSVVTGYIAYAIIIGATSFVMREYRDNSSELGVSYGKALGLGTKLSFYSSLVYSFFTYVLFKLVDKSLMDKFMVFMEEQLLKSGSPESQVETMMVMYRKVLTPATYSIAQILSFTFMGFFFSLILAIFFTKKTTNPFAGVE